MGAKTLGGLETSGAYTYIFEDSSIRLSLLIVFPEKLILHFSRVFVSPIHIYLSDVIVVDTKNSWLDLWFWGIFIPCIVGHYRTFNSIV